MSVRRVAQRREGDGDDVEAVEEVLPEPALPDLPLEVAVGRRHHPHVHRHRLGPAHAQDLSLLQDAQQLHLQLALELADLVEEEGRAAGLLEEADLARVGPGEGALLVAEELGLEDGLGERPHVDGEKGAVAPLARDVEGPGHELLPRAALPVDEDGGARAGHLVDDAEDLLHAPVGAHQVLHPEPPPQLLPQAPVLAHEPGALDGPGHGEEQHVAVEGLGEVVEGPLAHGLDRGVDAAVGGHEDDARARLLALDLLEEGDTGEVRHLEVGEHDVEGLPPEGGEGGLAARRGRHLVAFRAQDQAEDLELGRLVVDDEDPRLHARASRVPPASRSAGGRTGRTRRTVVPPPGVESSATCPPWPPTIRRTRARPRPTPASFVEK